MRMVYIYQESIDVEDIEFVEEQIAEDCNKIIFNELLGLCGCGSPEDTYKALRDILSVQAAYICNELSFEEKEAKLKELGTEGIIQYVLYTLDDKGILAHGSSIGGARLTELGKKYLYVLRKLNFEE